MKSDCKKFNSYGVYFWQKTLVYSAPDAMGHFSKTELNLTHFYTTPNFLLDLWKYLAELNQKQVELLKKYFLMMLCGKEIYSPSWPNIYLPENMVRCTYIWRHQKSYIHLIIYVGFYAEPWYWKLNWTQARRQAPLTRGRRQMWLSMKGGPFWLLILWRLSIVV